MTNSISFSPRLFPGSPVRLIVRPSTVLKLHRPVRPSSVQPTQTLPLVPAEDRVTQGMLLGLIAVTIPAAVYSLVQVWNLVGSGTLQHAVQAFVP